MGRDGFALQAAELVDGAPVLLSAIADGDVRQKFVYDNGYVKLLSLSFR